MRIIAHNATARDNAKRSRNNMRVQMKSMAYQLQQETMKQENDLKQFYGYLIRTNPNKKEEFAKELAIALENLKNK